MKFTSHVRHIVSILSFCGMVVQQRKYEPFFFFFTLSWYSDVRYANSYTIYRPTD